MNKQTASLKLAATGTVFNSHLTNQSYLLSYKLKKSHEIYNTSYIGVILCQIDMDDDNYTD